LEIQTYNARIILINEKNPVKGKKKNAATLKSVLEKEKKKNVSAILQWGAADKKKNKVSNSFLPSTFYLLFNTG